MRQKSIDNAYHGSAHTQRVKLTESEEKLFCPRFVLKIVGSNSNSSNIQLHYTIESLMANIMNMLGNCDMVIQPFIK